MRDSGNMIRLMDSESFIAIVIKLRMRGIGLMTSSKVREKRLGRMVPHMKANISMERSRVAECSNGAMEICTLVILRTTKWMVMVCTFGRVVKSMMENGRKIGWMEKGYMSKLC
jgi:rRNA maturation endonuclease Nob1